MHITVPAQANLLQVLPVAVYFVVCLHIPVPVHKDYKLVESFHSKYFIDDEHLLNLKVFINLAIRVKLAEMQLLLLAIRVADH